MRPDASPDPRPLTTLDALPAGAEAQLVELAGARGLRCRLMEMGLLPGARVRVVRRNDLGGVLEVEVRRVRVSLRRPEARALLVASAAPAAAIPAA